MRTDEHDVIDDSPGAYFVTARRDDGMPAFLLGPYDSHLESLENVEAGRRLAESADPRAYWYRYGTCRIKDGCALPRAVFGRGEP